MNDYDRRFAKQMGIACETIPEIQDLRLVTIRRLRKEREEWKSIAMLLVAIAGIGWAGFFALWVSR